MGGGGHWALLTPVLGDWDKDQGQTHPTVPLLSSWAFCPFI